MSDVADLLEEFPAFCSNILSYHSSWVDRGRPSASQDPGLKDYVNERWQVMFGVFTVMLQSANGLSRREDSHVVGLLNQLFGIGLSAAEHLDEVGASCAAMPLAPELKRLVREVAQTQLA